ncbi:MAG: hypothetical protein FWF92_01595 [Oscillospiraceae bacterium]|nr:hypothetical protein [Oscillospiraceae bacterium]
MKAYLKKFTSVLLIAALIISVLFVSASCGSKDDNSNNADNIAKDADNANANANQEDVQNQNDSSHSTEKIYPDLPAKDFGGYEFKYLTRTIDDIDWAEWNHRDLFSEELNGDILNDAVFNRNKKIEEKYNIIISETVIIDFQGTVRKTVKAGDDAYDVVCTHLVEVASLAQDGSITDLFSVPNLDFSKPWWNQNCPRDLSIGNRLFVMQGDLLIMDNDAMEAMIFNKALLRDAGLDDPYVIVKNGEWTFGKLIEMSRGVSKDLNGDGQMYIKDDLFGCILQSDTDISFLVSGGEKVASKDENDYPIVTFGSERCYKIMEAVSTLMLDEDNVVQLHRYYGKFGIYDEQVKMMQEDRALFSWIRMRVVERLRGMETDFGIIPLPKLDKSQEKYITHNNPHTGAGISIPRSASDLERTGMILEDLSAESKYTLQPAYYEVNLRGKYARDDESQEMLDIILNNTAYDIGYIYDFGGFAMSIIHYGRDKKTNYASTFEKAEQKMWKDIEKTIAAYEKID